MIYLAAINALTLVFAGGLFKALLDERGRAEAAWQKERAALCQRLQAPQHAIVAHHNALDPVVAPPAVLPDDDDDWWASREEIAERMAAQEMETKVNGGD